MVLADDETHLDLLVRVRHAWMPTGIRHRIPDPGPQHSPHYPRRGQLAHRRRAPPLDHIKTLTDVSGRTLYFAYTDAKGAKTIQGYDTFARTNLGL